MYVAIGPCPSDWEGVPGANVAVLVRPSLTPPVVLTPPVPTPPIVTSFIPEEVELKFVFEEEPAAAATASLKFFSNTRVLNDCAAKFIFVEGVAAPAVPIGVLIPELFCVANTLASRRAASPVICFMDLFRRCEGFQVDERKGFDCSAMSRESRRA